MGSRSKNEPELSDKVEWLADTLEVDTVSDYTEEVVVQEMVRLQSKFPATIRLTGQVTGKRYEWKNAGSVVEVDAQDAPNLLERRVGRTACCGGTGRGNYLFDKLGGEKWHSSQARRKVR